jgi:hypothetical protein
VTGQIINEVAAMFNLSPQYEDTCWSRGVAPRILTMGSSWKESG